MKKYFILIFCLVVFSCKQKSNMELLSTNPDMMKVAASGQNDATAAASAPVIERKLIRNGEISIKVDDVAKTKTELDKLSKELSGYVSNESQNNYGDRLQYNQIIRIPANRFDDLVSRIEKLADKVESKNINTQDVTEEYIDIEARLKTKKELEARYREILQQAKSIQDILSIETQINSVRSEIESMEGRLNYLTNQVSFSTLNVTFYETIGTDFGFGSKFIDSIGQGWENLLNFFIGITSLWPFVIVLIAGVWFWRRRRNK